MMTVNAKQYKTEKRKANVGERILITNANTSMGYYDNGDVLTVASHYNGLSNGIKVKETKGDCPFIRHEEYEVIVEVKPSYPERISLLESQVAELTAKVATLEKAKKPKYTLTDLLAQMPSPNEQRKYVIDYAKDFVGRQQALTGRRVEYVVNAEKRTVVALIYRIAFRGERNGLYAKAIAKCTPDDVFNADIGKAIALGRALGLDVSEFENAVKPTELVVGQTTRRGSVYAVRPKRRTYGPGAGEEFVAHDEGYTVLNGQFESWAFIEGATIIDDTEAQY